MLQRVVQVCFVALVCSLGFSDGCRWIHHKFRQYNQNSLNLLDEMGGSTDLGNKNNSFPLNMYTHSRNSQPERQIWFIIQILEEISQLFDGDLDAVLPFDENKMETFLSLLDEQTKGLQSCITPGMKKNKKLHLYFKRLTAHTLQDMDDNQQAWDLLRSEVTKHLKMMESLPCTSVDERQKTEA